MVTLPKGFEYLDRIDPTIMQNVIYYGQNNFIGKRINGYKSPRIILTKEAAVALNNVQQELQRDNFSLVLYDAYRPSKAVQHFVNWGENVTDQQMKESYYPYIDKNEIFKLGYLAKKSTHSRGSTVDLTIIELGKELISNPQMTKRTLTDGRIIPYFDDNTLDMYSSVDLMDLASAHDSKLIPSLYLQNRNYLRSKMQNHNFKEYSVEWWHYTLQDEPYPDQYFDFDIE